jgi:hypothetical protein
MPIRGDDWSRGMTVRQASFALRVVRRRAGDAGILYRRTLTSARAERLTRIRSISPLAFSAAMPLLRAAVRASGGTVGARIATGPYHALDPDWGARVACYALVASGLRDGTRLSRAAGHLKDADAAEAAWWFGAMTRRDGRRAIRALRILTEATR